MIYRYLKIKSLIILFLVSQLSLTGQVVFNGRITDTVKCLEQPTEAYALYVPSSYNGNRKWPLIYIFDPAGRGITGVKAFRMAAEKYGYLLACSYNSRNGPLNANFAAAGYMFNDMAKRFSIDNKRIYISGFSGGSRVAVALATASNYFAGVIGCGAGLASEGNLNPTGKSTFVYYGIVGTRDMNYLEMFDLMTFFNTRTSVIPYLRIFDGGHEWPPPAILTEAVEWINLQAMKKKDLVADPVFVSYYSSKIKALVNSLLTSGNTIDAVRYLEFAIRDFSGENFASEMKLILTETVQSKEYQKSSLEWSHAASREKNLSGKYISSVQNILSSGIVPDTVRVWWKREISSLNKSKNQGDLPGRQQASRLLNFISILCSGQATALFQQKKYTVSEFFFELCTMSDGGNPNNYFNLARSLSALNKKREAIEELNKAIRLGFTSRKQIENEPAFNNIRNEEKYKLLIEGMK
jgi:hypothetical protein